MHPVGDDTAQRSRSEKAPSLPVLVTALESAQIPRRLDALARRGKLAGFRALTPDTFTTDAFGEPFDHDLIGAIEDAGDRRRIRFHLRMRRRMVVVFAILCLLTIEPGRYLLDQFIPGEWNWIDTRIWYYPLTILPLPWMWHRMLRKSRRTSYEHALEQIERIRVALDASDAEPASSDTP